MPRPRMAGIGPITAGAAVKLSGRQSASAWIRRKVDGVEGVPCLLGWGNQAGQWLAVPLNTDLRRTIGVEGTHSS